ncbi:hypothetical protein [Zavarzinia sp.]|uniref:hypothetical protein n=1 Tax=Zavarzinia sp. TaxID=2027920 RepID=UPI003BB49C5D|nr:alginate O-acetyltransferase AlgF [Zavarzinia sp.]
MVRRLLACAAVIAAVPLAASGEEIRLYSTGPGVVSGYVRFLDAAAGPVSMSTAAGSQTLGGADGTLIGRFQAVPAGTPQRATLTASGGGSVVELTVAADEFVTIAILADGQSLLIRDTPRDFNALKADIAFLNADPACMGARMRAGAKKTVVFDRVAPGGIARRLVNPAVAVVEAACGEVDVPGTLDLGTLEPGGRYSVVIVPDGSGGRRLIGGRDERTSYN